MDDKPKKFTLSLPLDMHSALTAEAKERFQSLNGLILSVLSEHVKSRKGEP